MTVQYPEGAETSYDDDDDLVTVSDLGIDPALWVMVGLAERSGFTATITLTTAGGTVSGTLVGTDLWLGALLESLSAVGEAEAAIGGELQETFGVRDREPDRGVIHLKNARTVFGGTAFPGWDTSEGMLWRGRISEVVGWSFGS